jgi:hypothetical protein
MNFQVVNEHSIVIKNDGFKHFETHSLTRGVVIVVMIPETLFPMVIPKDPKLIVMKRQQFRS